MKSVHKNFQLNGCSFFSVDELLEYSKSLSEGIYLFLEDWFSEKESVSVKTSGSTGTPKSIQLQKELMQNSAKATGSYFILQENTTALLCLPIEYIAGKMMLIRAITLGWHLDSIEANSNPLENVDKEYNFSAMVPLQLENSLSKIHLIKKIIVGGGVVSNSLQEKLQDISTAVFATYGMTETITHIAVKKLNKYSSLRGKMTKQSVVQNETTLLNNAKNNKIASLKKARKDKFYEILPNVTIYKDQRNCLVIDAPKVAKEIIFTNDVVNLISDTQFEWLGRFDNVINSGGIKLHPEKIEEKLSKIISNRFFVVGIKDEKLGEKLVLIIEVNESVISSHPEISGEKSLFNEIKNLTTLSKFEIPKEIHFIKGFVETETGKIQRKKTLQKIFTK